MLPFAGRRGCCHWSQAIGSSSLVLEEVQSVVGELGIQVLTLCGVAWHASQATFLACLLCRLLIRDVTHHSVPLYYCC